MGYRRRFSISVWVRITDALHDRRRIIGTDGNRGMSLFLDRVSQSLVQPGLYVNTGGHQHWLTCQIYETSKFFYWTNIVGRWLGDKASLHLFINGSVVPASHKIWGYNTYTVKMARTNCEKCYMSDLAIWFSDLTNDQIKSIYESGLSEIDHSRVRITAKSCKELMEEGVYTTSGYYWVNLMGVMKTVFCDMITDGGGWTEVTRINAKVVQGLGAILSDNINGITTTYLQKFALSSLGFQKLKKATDFEQIRLFCTASDDHSRTLDIATNGTNGTEIVDYLIEMQTNVTKVPCGSFYPIGSDTSYLKEGCQQFSEADVKNARIYTSLIQERNLTRLQVGFREVYNCDVWSTNKTGIFKYFVR